MKSLMEKKAAAILTVLEQHGFEAYFVGGYVRDKMVGRAVHDIDIATSAKPTDVMNVFQHTIPTGLKHGTVTVIEQGEPFEVTTFRTETEYEAHRRPKEVKFVSNLVEDLRRRDFTMNAMAMNRHGQLIDPFGGRDDLTEGVLRCVGNAEERFQEDALRMLRCVRFAAEYELKIDDSTWNALLQLKPLIEHIAMERVRAELERMMEGSHPEQGLPLFVQSGLAGHLKINLNVTEHQWIKAAQFAWQLGRLTDGDLRWHHLLWLLNIDGKGSIELLKKLTFSNERTTAISRLLKMTDSWRSFDSLHPEFKWKRSVLAFDEQLCQEWLEWIGVFYKETAFLQRLGLSMHTAEQLIANGSRWIQEMPAKNMHELNINGLQLQASFHEARGPLLGKLLKQLLTEAALGQVENESSALLERAKQLLYETI